MRVSFFALAVAVAHEFFQFSGTPGSTASRLSAGTPDAFAGAQQPVIVYAEQVPAAPGRTFSAPALAGLVASCALAGYAVGRSNAAQRSAAVRMDGSGELAKPSSFPAPVPAELEYDELAWRTANAARNGAIRTAENAAIVKRRESEPAQFGQMDDWTRWGGSALVEKFLYAEEGADTEIKRSDSPIERAIKRKPYKTFNKTTGMVELRTWDGREISTDYPAAELMVLGGGLSPELPVGPEIWDPLQLASPLNGPQEGKIYWYRQAEIKHGRVAMAACVGWFFPKAFGLFPALEKSLGGVDAASDPLSIWANLPVGIKCAFILSVGTIEFLSEREGTHYMRGGPLGVGKVPLGWDPLNLLKLKGQDEEKKRQSRLSELKNGRLAMIGIASLYAHSVIPGSVPALSYFNL